MIAARVEALLVKILKERHVLGLGVALVAGKRWSKGKTDILAHVLYSLSQETDDLRTAILSEPHGLSTLLQVVQNDHAHNGTMTKTFGKRKSKGLAAEGEEDRFLLLRLLISGELHLILLWTVLRREQASCEIS